MIGQGKTPGWVWGLALWAIWLAWASVWWNRGFYPTDESWEAVVAYQWLRGLRPYVDFYGCPPTLTGIGFFYLLIDFFGYQIWAFRLAFVLLIGLTFWLIWRLLRRLVPDGVAWRGVIAGSFIFLLNFYPWLGYNHFGLIFGVWAAYALARALLASRGTRALAWLAVCGLLSVATLLGKPSYGVAVYLGWLVTVISLLPDKHTRPRAILAAWALPLFSALTLGVIFLFLHSQGMLGGFWEALRQVFSYPLMQKTVSGQPGQFWAHTLGYYFRDWPRGLASLLLLTLAALALRRLGPQHPAWLRLGSWGVSLAAMLALAGLLVWQPRETLGFLALRRDYTFVLPWLGLAAVGLAAWRLWDLPRTPATPPQERARTYLWWLVVVLGAGLGLCHAAEKKDDLDALLMAGILIFPAAWAAIEHGWPRRLGFAWPRGAAWAALALVCLWAASIQVTMPAREKPFWAEYKPLSFPAMRFMRASNAEELDYILHEGQALRQRGGYFLAFSHQASLYPLTGSLLPTKVIEFFPDHQNNPHDPAFWRQLNQELNQRPPEMLIIQIKTDKPANWKGCGPECLWWPDMVKEVFQDFFLGQRSPRYRQEYRGEYYVVYRKR